MSHKTPSRAYEALTHRHLSRLAEVAQADRAALFQRLPHLAVYQDRILTVALCQGGALHYVDCKRGVKDRDRNGVKDLDVWTIYASKGKIVYPYRRRGVVECKMPGLTGWTERIDLLGRSLEFRQGTDPATVWRCYLGEAKTKSAQALGNKPVVLLEPAGQRGEIVWPV